MNEQQKQQGLPLGATLASKIQAKAVSWLWRNRIPKGGLTVVAGKRNQGKGLFAAHIAAEVSRNGGKVIFCAHEDDHGWMVKPRLMAARAKMENIIIWRFRLPRDHDELASLVKATDAKLLVMDPFARCLSGGVNRGADNVGEKVLEPLTALAEKHGLAVIINEHVIKRPTKDSDPLDAIMGGSSGLPAAARMGFLFGTDPDDSDRKVLGCVKFNITEKPEAVTFEVDVADVEVENERGKLVSKEMPTLMYEGECTFDEAKLLGPLQGDGKVGRKPEKRAAAAEWVTQYLAAKGGPVKPKEMIEDALHYNISGRTIRRAVKEMGVVVNGAGPSTTWELSAEVKRALGMPEQQGGGGNE